MPSAVARFNNAVVTSKKFTLLFQRRIQADIWGWGRISDDARIGGAKCPAESVLDLKVMHEKHLWRGSVGHLTKFFWKFELETVQSGVETEVYLSYTLSIFFLFYRRDYSFFSIFLDFFFFSFLSSLVKGRSPLLSLPYGSALVLFGYNSSVLNHFKLKHSGHRHRGPALPCQQQERKTHPARNVVYSDNKCFVAFDYFKAETSLKAFRSGAS